MLENFKENLTNLVYSKKFLVIVVIAALFTGIAFYYYNSYVAPRMDPKFATNKEFIKKEEGHEDSVEVYYFYTKWCPYCKKARPAWDSIKDTQKNVNGKAVDFKEVDCEENEKLAIDPNSKVTHGSTAGDGNDKPGAKSKVDPAIFRMAEERDY